MRKISSVFNRFSYDPDSGHIIGISGKPVGVLYKNGYLVVSARDGQKIVREYAHRLAFYLQNADVPKIIDHIDGDKTNNKWNNLRPANKALNALNANRPRSDSTTGFRGVYVCKRSKKYIASIRIHGKNVHLGSFCSPTEASICYETARKNAIANIKVNK